MEEYKHGLDFIFTDSVETPECVVSFDVLYHVASSQFLCSVSIFSDSSKLSWLLALNLTRYGARVGHYFWHVSLAGKMSTSKLTQYISSHTALFGF